MPSSIMDHRNLSPFGHGNLDTSSFFSQELFANERQVGLWKAEPGHHGTEGKSLLTESKSVSSFPLNKFHRMGGTVQSIEVSQPYLSGDQKAKFSLDRKIMESERTKSKFAATWGVSEIAADSESNSWNKPDASFLRGNHVKFSKTHYENGVFPNFSQDVLQKKSEISSKNVALDQSTDKLNSNIEDEEIFESIEYIEALAIGNLLPDDDELLSGVVDDIGDICRPINRDDTDDDIFYSVGGMELEADNIINSITASKLTGKGSFNSLQGGINGTDAGEHSFSEDPSRTLFVRNINSNVEDTELRTLFELYGDIHVLYTACKHQGFVMISYYDIRSACDAMKALQNKPLRLQKLDIHFCTPRDNSSEKYINQDTVVVFNLDSSVSNEDLHQIFCIYGEIKEIHETPHEHQHKFIEFYDVRAADAALHALHKSDIAGKKIKLEPSCSGDSRSLMKHTFAEIEQDEVYNDSKQDSHNSSPSGQSGSVPLGALTINSLETGDIQSNSAVRAPASPFIENAFHEISSSVPQNLSSLIRNTSGGNLNNHAVPGDFSHSLEQMNFGFQGMPSFHPHSLPEYHSKITNGIPYASSISRHVEGIDYRNLQKVKCTFDPNEAFGASSNRNFPFHSHQYAFNNTNAYHHQLSRPVVWSNLLPYMNTASGHRPPQMPGLPRSPMHMLKTAMPSHHVGSAPTVNPMVWDRRPTYTGDAFDSLSFHPASLGTIGLSGSPQFHHSEFASRGIFPHTGGICMEPSLSPAHIGIPSPQLRCQIMNNRNHMIPLPGSLDGSSDRIRSRRNDTSANQAENRKQYELDIERIVRGEESRTTLMLKNIPNKYTSKMLLAAIDENHRGTYDFIYLPIDFKNKCNVGYAFINMTDPQHIIPFYKSFNGKKWEKFNSEKVASLAYARIQGKASLIAHFQNSSLMNEDKRCRPILFHTDGPNAGDQEPFPMGMNIRSRSGRSRAGSGSGEKHDLSPSDLPNGGVSSEVAGSPDSIKD